MTLYECIIIVKQSVAQNGIEPVLNKINAVLSGDKTKIISYEDWGLRNFAYIFKKKRRGHYVACYFKVNPLILAELRKKLSFDEEVLRSLFQKITIIPDFPSEIARESQQKNLDLAGEASAG